MALALMSGNVGLRRTKLEDLNPNLGNILVVGIIIGKQKPHKFTSTAASYEGVQKAVWNFTLRDSVRDYANVTYWGSTEVVFQANDQDLNDPGESYRPMVTSPYRLTLNEKSSLIRHEGNLRSFLQLLRLPTKPLAGFVPLKNIQNNGSNITDLVNILVVVKGIRPTRTVNSKFSNETFSVRTVEVFDHTSPSFQIEMWDNDIIQRSDHWVPTVTILFITDLKVVWSNFLRQFSVKVTARSIVTENPEGKESQMLANYAKEAPIETFDIVGQIVTALDDPNIQDVMTVKQVQDKINSSSMERQFTAALYVSISSFDLDGLSKVLLVKCAKCKLEVKNSKCENAQCPTVYEGDSALLEYNFDIRLNISDHTGTLMNCRLSGQAAEQALNCTAKEFSNLSDEEKEMLKWKYLFEKCAVNIVVLYIGNQSPIISVLKLKRENVLEISRKLAVY
ncbi:unnamed protein product [Phyllotreta striolata]|uniref:Meiosis-specific with OB domain-containing protein n=1 Tax=Phyllotreta striolata TaxID=444603 RepID=A0A9N9THZ7_PHYSR|nr:unnamed protein product [Phyllotreta striolata]